MLKKLAHIAAGEDASLYVDQNGRLWAWGEPDNIFPICYFPPRFLPTQIPVLGDVAEIAVSNRSELLLKKDGSIWKHISFHDDKTYELTKLADDVAEIAAGGHHFLFIKKDGSLWAVGDNLYGQLGDGTLAHRDTPVLVRFDLKPGDLPPLENR